LIEGALPLTALIAGATALAFWLDWKVPAFSKIGASLLALIVGAILSNAGLIPATSPVYDTIAGPVTMVAIAWLLLAVNLSDLKLAGPRMVAAFGIAVMGTAVGAFVGALVFADAIGPDTWRLAGTLTGTYSGGSLNFVAVGRGLELPAALFAGATAADATMTAVWLAATLMLPLWIGKFYPPVPKAAMAHADGVKSGAPKEDHHPFFVKASLSTLDLAKLMALGIILLAAAEGAADCSAGWRRVARFLVGWAASLPCCG